MVLKPVFLHLTSTHELLKVTLTVYLSLQETYEARRQSYMKELQQREEQMRQSFVQKVKDKEAELKMAEQEVRC